MQNLFWKFSVLAGVIGASCFVVWQAHESLSEATPDKNPSDFTALTPLGEEVLPEADPAGQSLVDQLQPLHGLQQPQYSEPEPTLAEPPAFGAFDHSPTPATAQSDVAPESRAFPQAFFPAGQEHVSQQPEVPVAELSPQHDPVAEANPFLAMGNNNRAPSQAISEESEPNPFAVANPEPVELPNQSEPNGLFADQGNHNGVIEPQPEGLTSLPPSHPGPLLLPASDQFPKSEMPEQNGRLRTADAQGIAGSRVQTVAGDDGNAFLPLNPNLPVEVDEVEEVLPELAEPTPFNFSVAEEPAMEPVLPEQAGFGTPQPQPDLPETSPNPFTPNPTPVEPEPFNFAGDSQPEQSLPEQEVKPTIRPEPAPFEFGESLEPEPQPAGLDTTPIFPENFGAASQPSEPDPTFVTEEISSSPYRGSIPAQPRTIDHELLGDGTVDSSMPSGPQSPELKIEKIAPKEASIGQPLVYSIVIRNVGGSAANHVVVEDRIPRGAKLDGTIPQATFTNGKLIWDLGTLEPATEKKIQLRVIPVEAGDIGSVATVRFAASVSTSIRVTAPKLSLTMNGPDEVLVGKPANYDFTVTNSGQGGAKSVFLRALIPPGLQHPGGSDLEYEIGDLAPGQTKSVQLSMSARQMGIFTPQAIISIDGDPKDEAKQDLRIIESRLQITRSGPSRRFVSRPGTYQTKVTNQSSEVLRNVQLTEEVPGSVEPVANLSNWDPERRLITWTIPVLQPGETKLFTTELTPSKPGEFVGKLIAQDSVGNSASVVTTLDVKGMADLDVEIDRNLGPIAVGEQLSLRMSVANTGNASAENVQTAFQIPNSLQFVSANGPVKYKYDAQSNIVTFEAIPQFVAGGAEAKHDYDIVLTGSQQGVAEVKVYLGSDGETQQFNKKVTVLGFEKEASSTFSLGE